MSARKGRTVPQHFDDDRGRPTWDEGEPAQSQGSTRDVPRNCAGKVEHKYIAECMVKAGLDAFSGDPLDYGKLIQVLSYAQRLLKANWRQYVAEYNRPEIEKQAA